MGIRIIRGECDGTQRRECLVDSVTETAFGPLFEADEAQKFLNWFERTDGGDPRAVTGSTLSLYVIAFRRERAKGAA